MKRVARWVMAACLVAVTAHADDELLKNGSFEDGESGWDARKGTSVIEVTNTVDGTAAVAHVMQIEQDDRHQVILEQDFKRDKDAQSLDISYRIRTVKGPEGAVPSGDYQVKIERDDGWTAITRPLPPPGEWTDATWNFAHLTDDRRLNLIFEFPAGQGLIWLDDVSIKETK